MRSVSDGSVSSLQAKLAPDDESSIGELSEPLLRVDIEFQPKKEDHDLAITVSQLLIFYKFYNFQKVWKILQGCFKNC